jgi:hypothetical protein
VDASPESGAAWVLGAAQPRVLSHGLGSGQWVGDCLQISGSEDFDVCTNDRGLGIDFRLL